MIVPMKKLYLLCVRPEREKTLFELQEMGVVHLSHLRDPAGQLIEEARAHHRDIRRAHDILLAYAQALKDEAPVPPPATVSHAPTTEEVVDQVWSLIQQKRDQEEAIEYWRREEQRMEIFSEFNPDDIRALADKGVHIKLFRAGAKQPIEAPEGAVLHRAGMHKESVYFALISREPIQTGYEEIRLPDRSLSAIRAKIEELRTALDAIEQSFRGLARFFPMVEDLLKQAEDKVVFLEAYAGMDSNVPLSFLKGYCPANEIQMLREAAAAHGWGLLIEDVSPEEPAPTKIENPRWVRPISVVLRFIGVVPGYREVDISAVFLVFFSLFFAMIVGDAGYGLLFLGLTVWGHRKFRQWPSSLFHLLYVMSIGTIIWGALTGTFLGLEGGLPAPFGILTLEWLRDDNHIIYLCFLIGAIQLTIAHGWNVIRFINHPRCLAQAGWICTTWGMFFLACHLVLGRDLPRYAVPAIFGGTVMIALFMTPWRRFKNEWFNHVMLPLNLVGNFVDVVSYVRLFAVGTATYAVAYAFNDMGMQVGWGSILSALGAALIIFFGHALNIILAGMGVLVHGIRLNTLEFAGHLGLQWTGVKYNPFARKSENVFLFDEPLIDEATINVETE